MKELSLRELQLFCLQILKDVHRFCVDNNIKYSMQDGSLIGTARHKGFIPWDDDVDLVMPRPDYVRFCKSYRSDRYKLLYPERDKECLVAFARVYDDTITVTRTVQPWCNRTVGVWIDIFPADGAYDDINRHNRAYTQSRNLLVRSWRGRLAIADTFSTNKSFTNNLKLLVRKMMPTRFFVSRVCQRASRIPFGSTKFWTQMTSMEDNSKEHHRIETFEYCITMPFEDTEVLVMNGWEEVLRDKYNDYMQLTPVESRIPHSTSTKFYWVDNK